MNHRFSVLALALSLAIPFASSAGAQNLVDFRTAIRTAEPALLTVTVSPQDRDAAVAQRNNADQAEQDEQRPGKGRRIEFFDLDGQAMRPFFNGRQRMLAAARPQQTRSAAFAVAPSLLIAALDSDVQNVQVSNRHGETWAGTVVAMDYVTGLAAIKVDQTLESTLVVSVAATEPGMPVVAAWLDKVLKIDAGMISTHPIASGSGVGMTPEIDFGRSEPMTGAAVLDADGIVVGAMVPSRDGGLVCARAADLRRLIDAASGDQPQDLKRGLVGIQFEGGGPLVLEVSPESGAAAAGVKAGDLIEKVDDITIRDAADVVAAVASRRAGDQVQVVVRRGDESLTIAVELGEHPQQRINRAIADNGVIQMQQAFELKDGKLVPMEIDPENPMFPPGLGRFPMDDMFRDLQRGGVEGFQIERSDVEKTLKELQRQMEQLNEKLDQRP